MASLNPAVKKIWIEVQREHDIPVNAIGLAIEPEDKAILKIWRDEGIDRFMKGSTEYRALTPAL